jgi:hypothetical protein
MNGTVVARPARTTLVEAWQIRHQLDRRVRLDPGDACLVGKGHRPAAGWVGFEPSAGLLRRPRL